MNTYLAHISTDGREQTVQEHLQGTACKSKLFAGAFGCAEQGELIGALHDIGKCSEEFQQRLRGGCVVDHSTAGAFESAKLNLLWAAECIAGHHGGLPDCGNLRIDREDSPTLYGRIWKAKKGLIPPYRAFDAINRVADPAGFGRDRLTDSFIIRMLYSCLVDADYLDTESFMRYGAVSRSGYDDLGTLLIKLKKHIDPWLKPNNELNKLRCNVLKACIEEGQHERGLFSLTVPTGGGKTVSSLAFALEHAIKNGLDRLIYVIPYTSIIEQTADVFRKILGENNVVEHHSGAAIEVPEGADSLTKGNKPIYDQYAMMALFNMTPDPLIGYHELPQRGTEGRIDGGFIEKLTERYEQYIALLEHHFGDMYKKCRDIDRALWVYGHLCKDKEKKCSN